MLLSDIIANMIEQMLSESGGSLEIKRNDLAGRIGCVPSQINYVITSRFTPERGYIIESRRGGGGYIRIVKKEMSKNEYLMHFMYAIGESIDEPSVLALVSNLLGNGIVSEREAVIIKKAVSGPAFANIPGEYKNYVRADIMRHIIPAIMK